MERSIQRFGYLSETANLPQGMNVGHESESFEISAR